MNFIENTQQHFNSLCDFLISSLSSDEVLNLNLHSEDSVFVRFNGNRVRQNTQVEQRDISLSLQKNDRAATIQFSVTGNLEADKKRGLEWLNWARQECSLLPVDPYLVPYKNNGSSSESRPGKLLDPTHILAAITEPAQGADLAGLYCAGPLISANRNSLGQNHWFANENFFIDYSLYQGEKAVKSVYAGSQWDQAQFNQNLQSTRTQLELMSRPKKKLQPGGYRVYLAPGAVAELASMFLWGSFSYQNYKQGASPLTKLANKEKSFSPLLNIHQNFELGLTHRFNSLGELAPVKMDLVAKGQLQNFMISTRSAKEYGVESNFADRSESPRSLEIGTGNLEQKDVLKTLGTGLYLSNLHYLNWSDMLTARVTGMTRYACFWVENGEIVAPIADMRFDESLYDCLGANLEAVTSFSEIDPELSTYESRSFGGKKVPGMLINDFKFTL